MRSLKILFRLVCGTSLLLLLIPACANLQSTRGLLCETNEECWGEEGLECRDNYCLKEEDLVCQPAQPRLPTRRCENASHCCEGAECTTFDDRAGKYCECGEKGKCPKDSECVFVDEQTDGGKPRPKNRLCMDTCVGSKSCKDTENCCGGTEIGLTVLKKSYKFRPSVCLPKTETCLDQKK